MDEYSKVKKYKPFHETFYICTYGLVVGCMYPGTNKKYIRVKWAYVCLMLLFSFPAVFWVSAYSFLCIQRNDFVNLIRNLSIKLLFVLAFYKLVHCNAKYKRFNILLQKITNDLLAANDLSEDYQEIYDFYIRIGKMGQITWCILPILLSSQYSILATIENFYNSLTSETVQLRMVHDMELLFMEDKQYSSPFFEIFFVYCTMIATLFLTPHFVALDGSFGIATTHLRLKLKLMTHRLRKSFEEAKSSEELYIRVKGSVKEHQEALLFHEDLQNFYGAWLFVVFLTSTFMISFNLYQMHTIHHMDTKYLNFVLNGILHMYVPCYYTSNLIQLSDETPSEIMGVGWERWSDKRITKMLIFMIARSQKPLIITGNKIVSFNMELFISLMQTSYSFYTLITRGD